MHGLNSCQIFISVLQSLWKDEMNSMWVHLSCVSVSAAASLHFTSFYSVFKHFMIPCHSDLWSLTLRALVTVYSLTSSWLFIKNPSVSSGAWNLPADVGSQVTDWGCSSSMRYQSFTLLSRAKTLSSATGQGVVLLPGEFSLCLSLSLVLCKPLAGYMSPRSQSRTLTHNHSSCWIIQSKQWPTFEVGNKLKWRPGVESGSEADGEKSRGRSEAGRALTDGLRYWFAVRFRKKEAFLCDQQAWSAMWAPESSPDGLRVPSHDLWPPVNVIKQAGTRILQQAPIREASLHKECTSQ